MAASAMARHLNDNIVNQNGMNSNASVLHNLGRPVLEERSVSMNLTPGAGNGTKVQNGDSPWGNGWARAVTRESSRSREPSLFGNKTTNDVKTGSTALLPDTELWNSSPWPATTTTSTGPHMRSIGPSPVRRNSQMGNNQAVLDNNQNTSQYFPATRTTTSQRPTIGTYDASLGQRHSDGMINPYGHQARSSDETSQPRNGINSWNNSGSLQSPTDEHRGRGSYSSSREPSLPPSRNGNEHYPNTDLLSRFTQTAMPNNNSRHKTSISSLSNGRFPLERQGSQSDHMPNLLSQLSISNGQSGPNQIRPQSSAQSPQELYARNLPSFANAYDESTLNNSVGSFAPESFPAFQNPNPFQQQNSRFGDRGPLTASANEFRQSPYHSAGANSQVYDPSYPSYADQAQAYLNGFDQLEMARRLQAVQQQQRLAEPGRMMQHATNYPTRMNPHQPRFRSYDGHSQYSTLPGMPMPMQLNGMTLQPPMPLVPPVNYATNEIPRGPRGEAEVGDRIQSSILAEYKATHKSSARRWELKDIYGHVVEFSGDQTGSRFIQQRLETANSEEKEIIFSEMLVDVTQLMSDVFGNYVIQKFFEHGDQGQKKALANKMKTRVYTLALQMYGCRVVQKALEHILSDQQAELIQELEPYVLRCIKDQNGNHVIQKAIQCLDSRRVQFILDAIDGQIAGLANHPYGCRVIQRVLETCVEPAKRRIFAELHACGSTIIADQYGNYVAQNMMQHGSPEDRAKVIALIKQNLVAFAKHKFASNVVERCLEDGSPKQQRELMEELISRPDATYQLIRDSYGNYVIQKFLEQLENKDYDEFVEHLKPEMAKARLSVTGKQIAAVDQMMHKNDRFDTPNMAQPNPAPASNGSQPTVSNRPTNGAAPTQLTTPQTNLPPPGSST